MESLKFRLDQWLLSRSETSTPDVTTSYLLKQGYTDIAGMEGGMKGGWVAAGYPVE